MELYKQYLKEREDIELVYTEDCFVSYKIHDGSKSAAIMDIYSRPEVRGQQVMKGLVEDLIEKFRSRGVNIVLGYTDITTNGWKRSEQLMLKFGFQFKETHPEDEYRNVYFMKLGDM